MYVAHVEPMEWHLVRIAAGGLWVAGLAILLRFSKLGDDRNP